MNSYRYRVTVEMLTGQRGEPVEDRAIAFDFPNHDDLLAIVGRVRERWPYPAHEAAAMAIGLKLLSEVALAHRRDELFAELRPALSEFIGKVKAGPVSESQMPQPLISGVST